MKFIIKLFPEIMIKSDSVRKRFIKILTSNIRNVLLRETENVAVIRNWDFIEVRAKVAEEAPLVLDLLKRTPGIHHILEVEEMPFTTMHDIFEHTLAKVKEELEGKTFSDC